MIQKIKLKVFKRFWIENNLKIWLKNNYKKLNKLKLEKLRRNDYKITTHIYLINLTIFIYLNYFANFLLFYT
jgi:hypothetical protein